MWRAPQRYCNGNDRKRWQGPAAVVVASSEGHWETAGRGKRGEQREGGNCRIQGSWEGSQDKKGKVWTMAIWKFNCLSIYHTCPRTWLPGTSLIWERIMWPDPTSHTLAWFWHGGPGSHGEELKLTVLLLNAQASDCNFPFSFPSRPFCSLSFLSFLPSLGLPHKILSMGFSKALNDMVPRHLIHCSIPWGKARRGLAEGCKGGRRSAIPVQGHLRVIRYEYGLGWKHPREACMVRGGGVSRVQRIHWGDGIGIERLVLGKWQLISVSPKVFRSPGSCRHTFLHKHRSAADTNDPTVCWP